MATLSPEGQQETHILPTPDRLCLSSFQRHYERSIMNTAMTRSPRPRLYRTWNRRLCSV